MNTLKIETVPFDEVEKPDVTFEDFVSTAYKLKSGQSFVMPKTGANYRLALSVFRISLGRIFSVRKEAKDKYRVLRLK